jgi:hypothetical protein
MALLETDLETDSLGQLEERIQRAVALVIKLRQEKEATLRELAETQSAWEESQTANTKLAEELKVLHAERVQVRARVEKLLGHIDTLGTA